MLNIIVLIFEVLYYSLFMKFAKNDKDIIKYGIAFTLTALLPFLLIDVKYMIYYLWIFCPFIILKTFYKNCKIIDLPIITFMQIIKFIIEFLIMFTFGLFINYKICYIIFSFAKIIFVLFNNKKILDIYNKIDLKWNSDNFITRHGSTLIIMAYIIIALVFCILNR